MRDEDFICEQGTREFSLPVLAGPPQTWHKRKVLSSAPLCVCRRSLPLLRAFKLKTTTSKWGHILSSASLSPTTRLGAAAAEATFRLVTTGAALCL